jgi:hypothetical protein
VSTDRITPSLALSQLKALKESLEQSRTRHLKPSKEELYHFKYVVVLLQMSGFDVTAATWDSTDPESSSFPHAYQVLAQVDALITELEEIISGRQPRRPDFPIQKGYAFLIMAMKPDDPQLADIHQTIRDACLTLKLQPERVDDVEHTARISDRIFESIRKAEVVIADLTHNRPNCFYEAGYAHGLGKTVIFTARQGTDLQFDIQDYPVIFYSNMVRLRELLTNRLQAVMDRL